MPTKSKSKSKSNKRSSSSATKGWKGPQSINQRRALREKCGEQCFLSPEDYSYPICTIQKCKVSCKGLVSAKVRAGQYKEKAVYKKASKMINSLKCTKKSKKISKSKSKK